MQVYSRFHQHAFAQNLKQHKTSLENVSQTPAWTVLRLVSSSLWGGACRSFFSVMLFAVLHKNLGVSLNPQALHGHKKTTAALPIRVYDRIHGVICNQDTKVNQAPVIAALTIIVIEHALHSVKMHTRSQVAYTSDAVHIRHRQHWRFVERRALHAGMQA